MRKSRLVVALCLMLVMLGSMCFADTAKPAGKVVLTVKGPIANTNAKDGFQFDLEMLEGLGLTEYKVKDPWLGNKTYSGVTIAKILAYVGAPKNVAEVLVIANDGKEVVIKGADVAKYEIMLATKDGGKAIGSGLGGPVKLVFPYDANPGLNKEYPKENWSWFITTIEVKTK
ncbi:MAG: hypothetical protein PHQ21_08050 [Firmicutes bacterium]|jgi:hypothetical protein|nr:hypothetical protein [Bacillota bacterium]